MTKRTPKQCMRELREERARVRWEAVLENFMGPDLAAKLAELLAEDWKPPQHRWARRAK